VQRALDPWHDLGEVLGMQGQADHGGSHVLLAAFKGGVDLGRITDVHQAISGLPVALL
jgi:hypothetical protein